MDYTDYTASFRKQGPLAYPTMSHTLHTGVRQQRPCDKRSRSGSCCHSRGTACTSVPLATPREGLTSKRPKRLREMQRLKAFRSPQHLPPAFAVPSLQICSAASGAELKHFPGPGLILTHATAICFSTIVHERCAEIRNLKHLSTSSHIPGPSQQD